MGWCDNCEQWFPDADLTVDVDEHSQFWYCSECYLIFKITYCV